jgi:hypothetical protein
MLAAGFAVAANAAVIQYEVGGAQTDAVVINPGETVSVALRVTDPAGYTSADVFAVEAAQTTSDVVFSNSALDATWFIKSFDEVTGVLGVFGIAPVTDNVPVTFDVTGNTPGGQIVLGAEDYGLPGKSKIGSGATILDATILPLTITITPEPATLALLALGGVAVLRRRR